MFIITIEDISFLCAILRNAASRQHSVFQEKRVSSFLFLRSAMRAEIETQLNPVPRMLLYAGIVSRGGASLERRSVYAPFCFCIGAGGGARQQTAE